MGWIPPLKIRTLKPYFPEPQNMTVFGDKAFKKEIKLKWGS